MGERKTVIAKLLKNIVHVFGGLPPAASAIAKYKIPGGVPPGGPPGGFNPPDFPNTPAWDHGVHRNPDNKQIITCSGTAGLETAVRLRGGTTHIPAGPNGAYLVGSTGGLRKR